MESWGWANQVAHWSQEERHLLNKSWRSSTLTTYRAPIARWVGWCRLKHVEPKSPKGNDLARFLAKLYLEDKLAYITILLHKSAVVTYSAVEDLTKNFFVQQVLKAISIAKPQEKKAIIWDTELIFTWLKEVPSKDTLFDISRRTAIILLLASGRRVHDLTLLDIFGDNMVENHNKRSIVMWPRFGSKTDNAKMRQSGWLLKEHPDEGLCPVKHIKKLVEATSQRRSEGTDLTNLFISITGLIKPATRTIIAGWIKSIFREIGINAPPGSVRAAVASRSFLEERPLEEILKRANWRSAQTFSKHYCRPVERKETHVNDHGDQLADNFSNISLLIMMYVLIEMYTCCAL